MRCNDAIRLDPAAIKFLREALGDDGVITLVSGDASFRRYFRVATPQGRYIFMDAPPAKEDSSPFIDISAFLLRHGVAVPSVIKSDLGSGYLLIDDFGDDTFLLAIQAGVEPETLYHEAIEVLLDLQSTPDDGSCVAHGRPYDLALLTREFALFTDWYIEGILKTPITAADRKGFADAFTRIMDHLLSMQTVLVHRDYHCRNLMWLADKSGKERVGVLDFQDAVMGPVTYDLASLLRDCYVAWDEPFRKRVGAHWLAGAGERFGYRPEAAQFKKDFDWMALQRNLKAIGIFGRLSLRDGKHGYLNDIPRTFTYVHETLADHPQLADLKRLIEKYAS